MITDIIIDWGGVIADDRHRIASEIMVGKYGIKEDRLYFEVDDLSDKYATVSDCEAYYVRVAKKYGLAVDELKLGLNSVPTSNVFKLAKSLHAKGYGLHLLSNQLTISTAAIRTNNDLSFFDDLFFSNEINLKKPDLKIYKYALKHIKKKAEVCVFIDDREENIEAAKQVGLHTVWFKSEAQLRKNLVKLGVKL